MAEISEKKDKGEVIDLRQGITVVGTEKSKYYEKGKEYTVHYKLADKLVRKGVCTKKV